MTRLALVALLCAAPAFAEPEQPNNPEGVMRIPGVRPEPKWRWDRPALSLVPKIGVSATGMPFAPRGALELAWAPAIADRQLTFGVEGSLLHGSASSAIAGFESGVDEGEALALASFHWLLDGYRLVPFGGVGGGVASTSVTTTFDNGARRVLHDTRPALVAFVGAQLYTTIGAFELELRAQRAPTQNVELNRSSAAPIAVMFGYRLTLSR